MSSRNCLFPLLCTLVLWAATCAVPSVRAEEAKAWNGIEKMMTAEEYKAAGLDKLTPDELARLNQWMLRFIAYDAEQVVKSDAAVQKLQNTPVRRRIAGKFTGWTGKTTFILDNGEVWRQRLPGRYAVVLDNPEVEIARNLLGFHELKIVKTGKRIGVSRVK